jgi:hypothetical protein
MQREHATRNLEAAKQILAANEAVLYGIFGVIGTSRLFPPRTFLNEFLASGSDACDQDGRQPRWLPITVSPEEYADLKAWWIAGHANAVEDDLGASTWSSWVQALIGT